MATLDLLDRAVDEHIITDEQAVAIRALQHEPDRHAMGGEVPLYAEVLGYLGSILVVVGAVSLVAQFWDDLNTALRVAVLGGAALLLWGVGLVVDEDADPAWWRLRGVVWLLSSGALAASVGILAADAFGWAGEPVALATGGSVAVFAAALWHLRNRPAQHLAALVGAAVAVGACAAWASAAGAAGISVWALGAVWIALGLRDLLPPTVIALLAGPGLMLAGAGITTGSWEDAGPVLGLVTAGGLLGLGTTQGRFTLTGAGVAGLLYYVPATATHFFADTIGVPLTFLAAGVLLLVGGLRMLRRRASDHGSQ